MNRVIILIWSICIGMQAVAQQASVYEAGFTLDGTLFNDPLTNSVQDKSFVKSLGQHLNLTTAFLKTRSTVGNNKLCRGFFFYRVYPENTSPGPFTSIACDLYNRVPDELSPYQSQFWQNNGINIDLIQGLTAGNYILETFYGASEQTELRKCQDDPSIFLKNNNDYFTATIRLTPPLDIEFTEFAALTDNNHVFINWQTTSSPDLQEFFLEKSENGVTWIILDTILANGVFYQYVDPNPRVGVTYYRIRAAGSGKTYYTVTKRVYVGRIDNSITIYPNPVYRNLRFNMTAIIKGRYDIVVFDSDGKRISARSILHDGNDNLITIPLPESIARGIYRLVIYGKYEFYKQNFFVE